MKTIWWWITLGPKVVWEIIELLCRDRVYPHPHEEQKGNPAPRSDDSVFITEIR